MPLLKLISYGLRNNEHIIEKQHCFELDSNDIHPITKTRMNRDISKRIKTISFEIIDSLIQSKKTEIETKYLSQKILLKDFGAYRLQILLNNDSILIANELNENLLKMSGLQRIIKEKQNNSLFLFNSENSFYYIDSLSGIISKENNLTFSIKSSCENIVFITYDKEKDMYELSNGYSGTNRTINYYSRQRGLIDK